MDDLISRAAAIEAATDWKVKPDCEIFNAIKAACRSKIEQIAAVDAVPVVHGRWIYHDDDIMPWVSCSECDVCTDSTNKTPYCPNCGAKMDGERRDSE
jgi:uncharacterized paraquat-inducible protein A